MITCIALVASYYCRLTCDMNEKINRRLIIFFYVVTVVFEK